MKVIETPSSCPTCKSCVVTETPNSWMCADCGATGEEPVSKKVAKTEAVRQSNRNQRIIDAGLVQRKVVGHPDDFDAIRAFSKELYEKREIDFN